MSNINLPLKSFQADPYLVLKLEVLQERLRKAQQSFALYRTAIAASIVISITGSVLLLSGKTTIGAVTATGGLLTTRFYGRLAKRSDNELTQLIEDLKQFHEAPSGRELLNRQQRTEEKN